MAENLEAMRHSAAHLLAAAVLELWPKTKLAIGPAIKDGFYYDFDFGETKITEEDLPRIEKKMAEILPGWKSFQRIEVSATEAKKQFKENPYKLELIDEFSGRGEKLTLYKSGSFVDLCRGGHVENPAKQLSHFKLLNIAGAYWRGSEKNPMLTRIYGTVWPTEKELDEFLQKREQAEEQDHRKIGPALELFRFEDIAPGAPFWLPRGMIIVKELEKLWRKVHEERRYQEISTPILVKTEVFEISGHWEHYQHNMFNLPIWEDNEIEEAKNQVVKHNNKIVQQLQKTRGDFEFPIKIKNKEVNILIQPTGIKGEYIWQLPFNYSLKPMNCPESTYVYASKTRSYRDLPIRLSELGRLLRREKSGELGGLLRVRQLTMDDAHIYVTVDKMKKEILSVLELVNYFFKLFDFKEPEYYLSTRPEKYLGDRREWDAAELRLESALKEKKLNYEIKSGEGAFYGPKIDVNIKDSLERNWQLATIQLDFQMPKRFKLVYIDKNGQPRTPIMIHRAIFGTFERFIGILIEHFAGSFPVWLAPVQAVVLPITDRNQKYAEEVTEKLKTENIRIEFDDRNETLEAKIRDAQLQKIPYMLVVGDKEEKSKTIRLRLRSGQDQGELKIEAFLKLARQAIEEKSNL